RRRALSTQRRPATGPVPLAAKRHSIHALLDHGIGNAAETGDIGAHDQIARLAEFAAGFAAAPVDVGHDIAQSRVDLASRPLRHAGILLHFQLAGGNAAGIGRLARTIGYAGVQKAVDCSRRAGHVGALADAFDTV